MVKLTKGNKALKKSHIFLVEDHPVFRDGLSKLLNAEPDLAVSGGTGDPRQAIKFITKLRPDLVVVDIGLPGKSGLELIKDIRDKRIAVKLLAVSMFDEAVYAQRVLRAGGDGYVMKQEDPEVIVLAIRDVLAGRIYVSENVFTTESLKTPSKEKSSLLDRLTDSELEVLESLGHGKSAQEISTQVGLNPEEVDAHAESIRRKLKLKNFNSLIRYAVCWVEDSCQ
ncbi:MAG: response regulator transcription factor [Verrucomicrobiota bacterium]|jgi:DNA-binding NarL/FixJ family response regulator